MLGLSKMSGATTEQQQRTTNKDVVHTTTGGSTNYSSSIKYRLPIMHLLVRLKLPQRRLNPQLHSRSEKSHWQYFSSPKENRFHSGCDRSSMAANSQPQAIEGGGGRSSRGSSSISASSVTPGMTGRSPASTAAT